MTIESSVCAWLTTLRDDGSPHTTPVWFVFADQTFWIASSATNLKVTNVQRDPRVSLAIDGSGLQPHVGQGRARVHDLSIATPRLLALFTAKYSWDLIDNEAHDGPVVLIEIPVERWLLTSREPQNLNDVSRGALSQTHMVHGKTELIGGVEQRDIVIVPYDSSWADQFLRERVRIATALGSTARRVEHMGSTAVPGLHAKPIVDINVSVPDPEDEAAYVPQLQAAGYQLRVREPGHRMVRTADLGVHIHICADGSDWERRHLLFRDWLRTNDADREAYATLKRKLTERQWPHMNAYADAKSELIAEISSRAEAWAAESGWRVNGQEHVRDE